MEVGVRAFAPHVAVGHHFERGLIFPHSFLPVANRDVHREVRAHVKRRVNVDQVNFALELFEQGGHHQLVVAPDEPVAKIVALASGKLLFKQLQITRGRRALTWLIHRLDALHRHG
ncbi:MAG: hypothetical protein BWY17_05376 [Deltaproteobacteria bacterium ADurb.Bin207]|nr:MAG: hypothetical protein BWY17_05376 [Deltaproteobacteria bacterium ADurb.Bin207]